MAAFVAVALSYAALVSGVAGAGVPEDGGFCARVEADACRVVELQAEATDGDRTYATPAEVDCRALVDARAARQAERPLLSGDCESAPLDLRYRMSRFADSERPSGSLRSERSRRTVRSPSTATGLPPDRGGLPVAATQPMALYASQDLIPPAAGQLTGLTTTPLDTRTLDPPDRPPRV